MENKVYYKIVNKNKFNNLNETELARLKLREMMEAIGLEFDELEYSKNGKPYFKNKKYFFNYSHSKNYILIGISKTEIGVDIEEERNISDNISKKYLNDVDKKNRLKYWVIKESYVKLIDKPELLYEDINIANLKYNNKIIINSNYIASIMYDGNERELVEL